MKCAALVARTSRPPLAQFCPFFTRQVHSTARQPVKGEKGREEPEEREEEEEVERAQREGGGEGQPREGVHRDVHQLTEGQRWELRRPRGTKLALLPSRWVFYLWPNKLYIRRYTEKLHINYEKKLYFCVFMWQMHTVYRVLYRDVSSKLF